MDPTLPGQDPAEEAEILGILRGTLPRLLVDQPGEMAKSGVAIPFGVRDAARGEADGGPATERRHQLLAIVRDLPVLLDQVREDARRPLVVALRLSAARGDLARDLPAAVGDAGELELRAVVERIAPGDRLRDARRLVEILGGAVVVAGLAGRDAPCRQRQREEPSVLARAA